MGTVTKEEFVTNLTKAIVKKKKEKERLYYEYTADLIRDGNMRLQRSMRMKNVYSEV